VISCDIFGIIYKFLFWICRECLVGMWGGIYSRRHGVVILGASVLLAIAKI
jgi:hypothetical protein